MTVRVVIPAAGLGARMNSAIPKQFLRVAGKPILQHTLEAFQRSGLVDGIVLSVPRQEMDEVRKTWGSASLVERIVEGGAQRQDSVYNGLASVSPDTEIVLVHDGVRPFADERVIRETIAAAREFGAAIAAIPLSDTVKRADENRLVRETVSRDGLWRMQTPQGFRYPLLKEAMDRAMSDRFYGTDEGMLVERLGKPVRLVLGSEQNIKITRPEDLPLAEMIAASRQT